MKRKNTLVLGVVGSLGAFFPVGAGAQAVTVRLGQNPAETFGEGYYASERGAFAAGGLDVQITSFVNGAAQAAACIGGSIDVGLGEATELANGVLRGLPFAIFASGAFYDTASPTTLLSVAANSTIRNAKDFEGQTIAVPALVSLSSMAVKAWLTKNGADLAKVTFIEMPLPSMAPAVARGTIAGAHLGEPYMTAAGTTLKFISAPYDAIAKRFVISDWFATRPWLAANPTVVKRLIDAIYDTAKWANTHHDDSAPMLAKYTKIDVDVIRKMRRLSYATSFQPQLIQPVLDAAVTYGGLARRVALSDLLA